MNINFLNHKFKILTPSSKNKHISKFLENNDSCIAMIIYLIDNKIPCGSTCTYPSKTVTNNWLNYKNNLNILNIGCAWFEYLLFHVNLVLY